MAGEQSNLTKRIETELVLNDLRDLVGECESAVMQAEDQLDDADSNRLWDVQRKLRTVADQVERLLSNR